MFHDERKTTEAGFQAVSVEQLEQIQGGMDDGLLFGGVVAVLVGMKIDQNSGSIAAGVKQGIQNAQQPK
jgi:hypothetical protein